MLSKEGARKRRKEMKRRRMKLELYMRAVYDDLWERDLIYRDYSKWRLKFAHAKTYEMRGHVAYNDAVSLEIIYWEDEIFSASQPTARITLKYGRALSFLKSLRSKDAKAKLEALFTIDAALK